MNRGFRAGLIVLALLASMLLSGCGGTGTGEPAAAAPPVSDMSDQRVMPSPPQVLPYDGFTTMTQSATNRGRFLQCRDGLRPITVSIIGQTSLVAFGYTVKVNSNTTPSGPTSSQSNPQVDLTVTGGNPDELIGFIVSSVPRSQDAATSAPGQFDDLLFMPSSDERQAVLNQGVYLSSNDFAGPQSRIFAITACVGPGM